MNMKILPDGLEAQTREKWPAATGVSQHTVTTTEVVEKMKKRKKLAWQNKPSFKVKSYKTNDIKVYKMSGNLSWLVCVVYFD